MSPARDAADDEREAAPGWPGGGDGPQVPVGDGRTQLPDNVMLRLGLLRGLSEFLWRGRDADGVLRCPRHRVEHTGKNVYAALIDLQNWRFTREDLYLDRARRAVLRTVDMLGLDPESRVPVFLPGRSDPRNASTNSIDGGACADTLATLLEEAPEAFSDSERQRIAEALTAHVEGYLRHSARDRPIPAQRLWAATGVARAARVLQRSDWAADALTGCALALDELAPDGVAPYIPEHSQDCSHVGLADTSGFYHSRTPGFVLYVHEILGVPLPPAALERVQAALLALVALRDGRGRKVLHNEAKAWYWEGEYEVASHPFDVWALVAGARVLPQRRELLLNEAGRAMEEWIAHVHPDGGVLSHHGRGIDFQCRIFWTSHAAWIARVMHATPLHSVPRGPLLLNLPESGLVHVETGRATAVLRGRHRRPGNLFGCDFGGGQVQSLVVHDNPRIPVGRDVLVTRRFRRDQPGSFRLRPRGGPGRLRRWAELLSAERGDLRFRFFVTAVEWRAREFVQALFYPLRHVLLRPWRDASPWLASHLDLQTGQTVREPPDGTVLPCELRFEGGLADVAGRRWPGVVTQRQFSFFADRIEVRDAIALEKVRGSLRYRLPAALTEVELTCRGATLRRSGLRLSVSLDGRPVELVVRGVYRC